MSSFTNPRKHSRESSGSITDENINTRGPRNEETEPALKRRKKKESRQLKRGYRVQRFQSRKDLGNLDFGDEDKDDDVTDTEASHSDSEYVPTSPQRPSVSPLQESIATISRLTQTTLPKIQPATVSNDLSAKITQVSTYIAVGNLQAAYKLLTTITKTAEWQATATLDSAIQIFNYTQLLGDGKKQGLEQARIINELRRKLMEADEEVKALAREVARSRAEDRE